MGCNDAGREWIEARGSAGSISAVCGGDRRLTTVKRVVKVVPTVNEVKLQQIRVLQRRNIAE